MVVQLDELERNKMAPDATPIMPDKWQKSAVYARCFGCNAVHPEPPKIRAGGVGVAGSNPVVPTNFQIIMLMAAAEWRGGQCCAILGSMTLTKTLHTHAADDHDRVDWRAMPGQVWRMSLLESAMVPIAWLLLAFSAVALAALPFRWVAKLLGQHLGAIAYVPTVNAAQFHKARLAQQAVRRAAKLIPFRSDCLRQALAGSLLCAILRVPTSVHLGVQNDTVSAFAAHAMLHAGPVAISGGNGFGNYAIVSCFVRLRP